MLEAERLAAVQRALAFANMSVQGKLIEALRQQCEGWATRMGTGNLTKQTADSGKAGLFQDAGKLVTQALAAPEWTAEERQALASILEEWLPKVVAPWEKDQRKKLRLSALRGQ